MRGFPDSQDLCSSEEEPPLELEDFLSKKVGTNNLPKFDHKQYLKRRLARKAARDARREAGEDVLEPQRPRLPGYSKASAGWSLQIWMVVLDRVGRLCSSIWLYLNVLLLWI